MVHSTHAVDDQMIITLFKQTNVALGTRSRSRRGRSDIFRRNLKDETAVDRVMIRD